MSKDQVARLVQDRLRDCHPSGVDLKVLVKEIRLKDGYWYVPVQPSEQPQHTFEYYDVLAEVETDLSERERLRVWLVPTLPEEAQPSEESAPLAGRER